MTSEVSGQANLLAEFTFSSTSSTDEVSYEDVASITIEMGFEFGVAGPPCGESEKIGCEPIPIDDFVPGASFDFDATNSEFLEDVVALLTDDLDEDLWLLQRAFDDSDGFLHASGGAIDESIWFAASGGVLEDEEIELVRMTVITFSLDPCCSGDGLVLSSTIKWEFYGSSSAPGEELTEEIIDFVGDLGRADFRRRNLQRALLNTLDGVLLHVQTGGLCNLCEAVGQLANDILPKTDGEDSPTDWVTDTESQEELEDKVVALIEALEPEIEELGDCDECEPEDDDDREPIAPAQFKRGDANGDGVVNALLDGTFILNWGFGIGDELTPPAWTPSMPTTMALSRHSLMLSTSSIGATAEETRLPLPVSVLAAWIQFRTARTGTRFAATHRNATSLPARPSSQITSSRPRVVAHHPARG